MKCRICGKNLNAIEKVLGEPDLVAFIHRQAHYRDAIDHIKNELKWLSDKTNSLNHELKTGLETLIRQIDCFQREA